MLADEDSKGMRSDVQRRTVLAPRLSMAPHPRQSPAVEIPPPSRPTGVSRVPTVVFRDEPQINQFNRPSIGMDEVDMKSDDNASESSASLMDLSAHQR